ncbi:dystroglycan-type cadherin-like protein [Vibrio fortis]|uniref:Dystroglycan-type cadherin-like protein n=1 Tax=Vibrio fortis TaxID=212667 RepID=A0A066UR80_9VIBR|nr:hypothetical protein [Vibrio fortis]KDN29961.1 dystroglycan-type cadherin-like protein [Vibrio fortis]
MQISKVATAVALSTGLLFGCNSDGLPVPTDPVAPAPDLKITSGYWQLGTAASATSFSTSSTDLPNVYVFSEDGNHKYYDDDATPGTYVIKDASASTNDYDEDAGTISFMLYDSGTTMKVSGEFTLTEASGDTPASMTFVDEDNGVDLSGSDEVDNDSVKDAVVDANEDSGINNVVQILDTNFGGAKNDVGELRLKLSESATVSSIASGKLSVDLIYQVDADTNEEANDSGNNAYISLYGAGTSNTNLHGEVIFNAGEIFYRSTVVSGGKPQISEEPVGTYELGEDLAVEVSWANGYYTFTINDTVYDNSGNGFESFDDSAVTVISLKLGDTSNTTHYELIADNFMVYSNDETDNQVVFEDNFDSYANGAALGGSDPYNNNSAEATVVTEGEDPTDPTDPEPEPGEVTDDFDSYTAGARIDAANSAYAIKGDKDGDDETTIVAEVSTEQASSGDNSLLLHDNSGLGKPVVSRTFAEGAESGSVSTKVYVPADGYVKSTYLYLGDSTSGSSSSRFTELVFGSSAVKFRNESGSQKDLASYAQDAWVDVTMAWEPNSDSSGYDVTITVDGQEYTSYEDGGQSYSLVAENASESAPTLFAVYVGDNGTSGTYSYFDDLDSELF